MDVDLEESNFFQDPSDFYPPSPPPTTQSFTLASGPTLTLHLVGHSPLEAHRLWNGSKAVSRFFEAEEAASRGPRGRTVLELGAGAGLPSLACGVLGAARAVVTDFPDVDLVANMQKNVDLCDEAVGARGDLVRRVLVRGFIWGGDPGPLLDLLDVEEVREEKGCREEGEPGLDGQQRMRGKGKDERGEDKSGTTTAAGEGVHSTAAGGDEPTKSGKTCHGTGKGFDIIIMADLLFRHSEHGNLVKTVRETMRRGPHSACYVFFTSYRPWLRHKDLAFFDLARAAGFRVDQVLEEKLDRPMFADDPGDVEVLKTVTGWTLRWAEVEEKQGGPEEI